MKRKSLTIAATNIAAEIPIKAPPIISVGKCTPA
jgi:hypothetical protein